MKIVIDNKPCVCEPGEYLMDIAARNGIYIPSLCHHDGLPGQACCRVCIVEIEIGGKRNLVTACVYPVEQELTVFTNNEYVERQRRMVLELLRSKAPQSAEVTRLCEQYSVPQSDRLEKEKDGKCILCGLCVNACRSLGTGAIGTAGRGVDKVVTTPYDEPSLACVGCASCAAVCPTGFIEVSESDDRRSIWNKTFQLETCKNCGAVMGTLPELWRAAQKQGLDETPELCETCRKKAITDVMAATYGR